jgi:hypothetical protein
MHQKPPKEKFPYYKDVSLLRYKRRRRRNCLAGPCSVSSYDLDDKLRSFTCKSTGCVFKEHKAGKESSCRNRYVRKKRLRGTMDSFILTSFLLGSRKRNYFVA